MHVFRAPGIGDLGAQKFIKVAAALAIQKLILYFDSCLEELGPQVCQTL